MKKLTLMGAILSCALITAAHAQEITANVTIDITGATAFREAALKAIKAGYDNSGQAYQFAHDQPDNGWALSTRSIWKGKFGNGEGNFTTTIRTSFNGSVEGIRALVETTANPTYYADIAGNLITPAAVNGGQTNNSTSGFLKTTEAAQSEIAFSDVFKASTPYSASPLQPSDSSVGVVVFTMLTNEGSTITNVTSQQFRALLTKGYQPLSLFTGNQSDSTLVFATGRNDGSGTRTTYLAETGYGITQLVNQYIAIRSSGNELKAIQLVPVGGVNSPLSGDLAAYNSSTGNYAGVGGTITQSANNASTVWNQNLAGNGGYSSGSALRSDMGRIGTSVYVFDGDTDVFQGPIRADLVTWLSLSDAAAARSAGGIVCAYNGVKLDGFASTGAMTVEDKAKVTNGLYTAWGYQQMYYRNNIGSTSNEKKIYDAIRSQIPTNLGTAGISISEMRAGREVDGGVVAP